MSNSNGKKMFQNKNDTKLFKITENLLNFTVK